MAIENRPSRACCIYRSGASGVRNLIPDKKSRLARISLVALHSTVPNVRLFLRGQRTPFPEMDGLLLARPESHFAKV